MQAITKLYKNIKQSLIIKQLLQVLDSIHPSISKYNPIQFSISKHHQLIHSTLEKLIFNQLQNIYKQFPTIPYITAIIIKTTENYTLAIIMIPQGKNFGWHDHSKMNGLSRIIAGEIVIKSINPQHLQKIQEETEKELYYYPVDRIRQQKLSPTGIKTSLIYPDSFNLHYIYGVKQSCFLDLLIPEYPDNLCNYYQTYQNQSTTENDDKIKIKKINKPNQQIIGLATLAKIVKQRQKKQKNIHSNIIQMPKTHAQSNSKNVNN